MCKQAGIRAHSADRPPRVAGPRVKTAETGRRVDDLACVLPLENPADEAQAIAVNDRGMPAEKPIKAKTIKYPPH